MSENRSRLVTLRLTPHENAQLERLIRFTKWKSKSAVIRGLIRERVAATPYLNGTKAAKG